MTTPELFTITGFFDRYHQHTQSQVEEFQTKFDALKIGFSRIRNEVLEEARMMAPAFNVFSVLGKKLLFQGKEFFQQEISPFGFKSKKF